MDASIQQATAFLNVVKDAVGQLEQFAYSVALRFDAPDRAPAEARMLHGGHFSLSCGFAVDHAKQRWLLFAICIEWAAGRWIVKAAVEDEDASRTKLLCESKEFPVVTLGEFAEALQGAIEAIKGSLAIAEVGEIIHAIGKKRKV